MTNHKKDYSAILKLDGFINSSSDNLHEKRTTRLMKLLVELRHGSVYWFPLKDLKQSNPVDLSEHAMANEIIDEPAFNW